MACPPQVWDGVLRRLREQLSPVALEAWVDPIEAEFGSDGLRLVCPTEFHRDRVRERYLARIRSWAEQEHGQPVRVTLVVRSRDRSEDRATVAEVVELAAGSSPTERRPRAAASRAPEPRRRAWSTRSAPEVRSRQQPLPYTFATFVVGPGNALAREACLAVARGRQMAVSPLYLVGGAGLGKTHLATAVVAEARQHRGQRAVYVSAEQFTNEFMTSIRSQRTADFKRRYRDDCDVLVVEDVQFLRGKKATQLELFHTLEWMARRGARVVITAERLPKEIPDLDPRLASRLGGGLCAEIEPPDASLRREILRAKAAAGGVNVPGACLDRLVEAVSTNVRDLESVLIQLVASGSLLKRPIDLELTEAALRKVLPQGATSWLEPDRIVAVVASYFKTSPESLASRSRRKEVLVPRQLAMYLCGRYTDASLKRIGRCFGRNHPSVANAIQVVERGILERAPLRYQVEALVARLDALAGGRPQRRP